MAWPGINVWHKVANSKAQLLSIHKRCKCSEGASSCSYSSSSMWAIKVHGKSCEKGEDYALNANATFGPDVANSHLLSFSLFLSFSLCYFSFPAYSSCCKLGERIRTFVSAQARPLRRSEVHTPRAIRMTNMCDTPLAPVVYL